MGGPPKTKGFPVANSRATSDLLPQHKKEGYMLVSSVEAQVISTVMVLDPELDYDQ